MPFLAADFPCSAALTGKKMIGDFRAPASRKERRSQTNSAWAGTIETSGVADQHKPFRHGTHALRTGGFDVLQELARALFPGESQRIFARRLAGDCQRLEAGRAQIFVEDPRGRPDDVDRT